MSKLEVLNINVSRHNTYVITVRVNQEDITLPPIKMSNRSCEEVLLTPQFKMMSRLIDAFGYDAKTMIEYIKHGTNYKTYAPNISLLSYKFVGPVPLLMRRLIERKPSVDLLKHSLLYPVILRERNSDEPYECMLNDDTKTRFILTQTKVWKFNNVSYVTCKGLVVTGDKINIITSPYFQVDKVNTYLPQLKEFNTWINILKLLGEDAVRLSTAIKVSDAVVKGIFKTKGNNDINTLLSLRAPTLIDESHLTTLYKHFLTMAKGKD